MTRYFLLTLIFFLNMNSFINAEEKTSLYKVEESIDIAEVPAGFPVGFCLLTHGDTQYVAYYDKDRNMTVASRKLDSKKWKYQVLSSKVGWDSHNYITMIIDRNGDLHLSGNMHAGPLVYFRTEKSGDISTLKRLPMTGKKEKRSTYPKFVFDGEKRLIFHYRDGGSGRGNEIYNVYDAKSKTWSRLLDKPLSDGEGKMNAYMAGPSQGPDGWFHSHWVWRDTPNCATNHHLSYARSKDFINWESVFGEKIKLPIKLNYKSLWVDPIPSGGGIINGGHRLYFDSAMKPIITYHKSDSNSNMQIYAARPEKGKWKHYVLTDWDKPVEFSGGGSMGFIGIRISNLSQVEPGILKMTYRHRDFGNGTIVIDEKSMKPIDKTITASPQYPKGFAKVQSDFPGMKVMRRSDTGTCEGKGIKYILKWETLGRNRDKPRKPPLPEPSMLRLYKLSENR